MTWKILQGDVLDRLRDIPDESVQCCVTSPPYWSLRDYGVAGQIGMENTPDEHVAKLVEVFREVRRVLRKDGILWLNYGDAYAAAPNGSQGSTGQLANRSAAASRIRDGRGAGVPRGLKPKDLIGLPWRLARALQEPYYTGKIKDERDRIWLAAMIDGEGSICGSRHTRSDGGGRRTNVGIFITNTCNAILDEAHRIWPGSRYVHQKPGTDHLGTREVHRWAVHGADGKSALLAELLPHLIAKRRQAVIAWNFLELVKRGRSRTGKTGPQSVEEKARREVLLSVLSDLNKGIDVEMPTWLADPPSMFEPGWWLRSDCIWHKPNPMPESVRDRPTKAHEYVFLLAKSQRYYYDADAIAEPADPNNYRANASMRAVAPGQTRQGKIDTRRGEVLCETRNLRSVWTIATQPTPEAHFATFPEELAERCIKAGSRRGDTVIDPFCGSGTTMLVAERLGRDSIGIELNPAYIEIAERRIRAVDPTATVDLGKGHQQKSLFGANP